MFSPQLLITPQRSAELGRYLVTQSLKALKTKVTSGNPIREASISVRFRNLRIEHGGQSGRETPEPFPNSEDKPVHVLYCTQMRELSGNTDRCLAHLTFLFNSRPEQGLLITIILIQLSMPHGRWVPVRPKSRKSGSLPRSPTSSLLKGEKIEI